MTRRLTRLGQNTTMTELGQTALGAWSGGHFMHFGERIDDRRLDVLLRPDERVRTVVTADVYGQGDADRVVGAALADMDRDAFRVVGMVATTSCTGRGTGPRASPASPMHGCGDRRSTRPTSVRSPSKASSDAGSTGSTC